MLLEYLIEHYSFLDPLTAEKNYRASLEKDGAQIIEKPFGFIIYKFEGDACLIKDLYTTLEARKIGKAWELFHAVKKEIDKNPRCNVILGFSEFGTKHRERGIGAMLAAGFIPYHKMSHQQVFIRGVE